jgi:hypothetical protein
MTRGGTSKSRIEHDRKKSVYKKDPTLLLKAIPQFCEVIRRAPGINLAKEMNRENLHIDNCQAIEKEELNSR